MSNFYDEILTYLKENRVSTTEVADALGKSGVIDDLIPINDNQYKVGKVKCIFTAFESNYDIHEQIKEVQKGDVVLVFEHECKGRALFGELVTKYLLLYRGANAVIVNGKIRDYAAIKREGFSIWARGRSPLGCFNQKAAPFPIERANVLQKMYENGIAICDDGGVVVIPQDRINEEMLDCLKRVEMKEDIWFFCLDLLKWDTKKIVCDKAYLNETELLSSIHLDRLKEVSKSLD